ncbi:mitochondrial protein MBA1 [Geosmithia morbida]|uniref:Large ribosomal subunit protein mL45 n=1 Tax=Geosmithia morbida TaxID=1094350 RepID=A0A9P5D2U4_9HYPO|nr:mitochondrial protein MBA1 [Geosmithia morbida]KAF4119839.1 mitochondrial protein MBA1 [Geosmithia morbida]
MSIPYRLGVLPRRPVVDASPLGLVRASPFSTAAARRDVYRRVVRDSIKSSNRNNKDSSLSKGARDATLMQLRDGSMPMFPTTFVSAPITQYPLNPSDFLSYQWQRTKAWLTGWFALLGVKVDSMGNKWTTKTKFKVRRGKIAPTAKAMHRELLEAFAAGDKETIKKLCLPAYAEQFVRAIERRDRSERLSFELVKYNHTLAYPSLRSHLIGNSNMYDTTTLTEQAVVAIASTQKLAKYSASTGEVIPGSVKVKDQIEHIVLWRDVNAKTYETGPWRIWGNTNVTTLDVVRKRTEFWNKEQAKLAGWKTD